jgi:hypothetical protein
LVSFKVSFVTVVVVLLTVAASRCDSVPTKAVCVALNAVVLSPYAR